MFNRIKNLRKELHDWSIEADRAVIIAQRAEQQLLETTSLLTQQDRRLTELRKRVAELEYAKWPRPSNDTRSRPQLPNPKYWYSYQDYRNNYRNQREYVFNYSRGSNALYYSEEPVTYPEYVEYYESRKPQPQGKYSSKPSAG
jgi:hypothetical protein